MITMLIMRDDYGDNDGDNDIDKNGDILKMVMITMVTIIIMRKM